MKRLGSLLLCWGTFFASWYVYVHWMFPKLYPKIDAMLYGTALILTIFCHEAGHWLVMEGNGVRANMVFLVFLGGAMPWPSCTKKLTGLHWERLAKLYLAGVMGNLVMLGCCGGAWLLGYLTAPELLRIANLNGELILYNLLPIGILDGGRFAKVFFNSTPESEDHRWEARLTFVIGMLILMASILSPRSFIITGWLFLWGFHFQATHDDPNGSRNKKAMTRRQCEKWVAIYIALVFVGLTLLAATPKWSN